VSTQPGRSLLSLTAVAAAALTFGASMRPTAPVAPPRPLDELLHACRTHPDFEVEKDACHEAARRLVAEGRKPEAVQALNRACTKYPDACVTLALMYQFGDGVERDVDRAGSMLGRAGSYGDAYGWGDLRVLSWTGSSRIDRNRVERSMFSSCNLGDAGWPCYNYGVALACGYFGPPDLKVAHWAFFRGCDRGDERSCDLSARFQNNPEVLPCSLISPHPKFPYRFDLELSPADPDEPLPDGPDRFKRRAFSFR